MKLPDNVVIAEAKLTEYLLTWRPRNDKSGFLARAGFERSRWQELAAELRRLAKVGEAAVALSASCCPSGVNYSVQMGVYSK